MASSQTLGDALKRVARYSQITNDAKWRDLSERKRSSALMGLKFRRRCSASRRGDQITVQRRASFAAVHESDTRLPIWNVQIESVGLGLMRRDDGLVGFWRVPSRAHRLVSSGTCRICSHAM